jgi:hypothetical protein
MTLPKGTDPTQKFWTQPTEANTAKVLLLGWFLVASFGIMIVMYIIPQIQWIFSERQQYAAYSSWVSDVLVMHAFWVVIIMIFVGGLGMTSKKPWAYVPVRAALIAWFGLGIFQVLVTAYRYPRGLFPVLLNLLGIDFPPTLHSMTTLALNVIFIYGLISLGSPDMKLLLQVDSQKKSRAILLGLGIIGYAVLCYALNELLIDPQVLPSIDFQF